MKGLFGRVTKQLAVGHAVKTKAEKQIFPFPDLESWRPWPSLLQIRVGPKYGPGTGRTWRGVGGEKRKSETTKAVLSQKEGERGDSYGKEEEEEYGLAKEKKKAKASEKWRRRRRSRRRRRRRRRKRRRRRTVVERLKEVPLAERAEKKRRGELQGTTTTIIRT